MRPPNPGYALLTTDSEGRYRFRSIKPGAYPEDSGTMRARTFTSTCWAAATALSRNRYRLIVPFERPASTAEQMIDQLPCSIRLLPVARREAAFHDFGAYERLLEAGHSIDWRTYLIALLGGGGGMRVGEIVALEWADVDLERRQISIRT